MKKSLLVLLLTPVLCFSQGKKESSVEKKGPSIQVGGGYLFYPGSSGDVHIANNYSNNPLKSGFTLELTAYQPVNSFLSLGLGSSFNHFQNLGAPYIPVFADIRVIGVGKYQLFSFLDPGYGILNHSFLYAAPSGPPESEKLTVGFYIAYGFGVLYKIFYLQAKYNWFRFTNTPPGVPGEKTSKAYGVAGITFGVRLP